MSKKSKARGKGKQNTSRKAGEKVDGSELAEEALEPDADHKSIEERIAELSPEEAEMFAMILEITMKRRRFMLVGYILALAVALLGMVWALYMYGSRTPGTFIGWVFLVPPGLAAVIIILFGRWTKKIGT